DWKVHLAQADLQASGPVKKKITPVLYRPFDTRYTYYTGQTKGFICRPRQEIMGHMLVKGNLALNIGRAGQVTGTDSWDLSMCAKAIVDFNLFRRGGNVFSPLYIYPNQGKKIPEANHWPAGQGGRIPNLAPEFVRDVEKRLKLEFVPDGRGDLKKTFGPEDIFHYIYAVLHSPTYRKRYAEFLKLDFPSVPLTSNLGLFRKLCGLGRELTALHLMEPDISARLITSFPERGDNLVAKGYPNYLASGEPEPGTGALLKKGRVYINKTQYFDGAPPEVWEFHVGGYQVCDKWLKDRRGRNLDFDELTHYQKVITALKETIRLMAGIDAAVPAWPVK
ncbi:MAG: type ISP restriction/modification enzyme, partial [Thermodesulfobacteriota bacterium]|nr:type ISP restriction/modification enzyme [Thermodesulfobacteriota bacterium]